MELLAQHHKFDDSNIKSNCANCTDGIFRNRDFTQKVTTHGVMLELNFFENGNWNVAVSTIHVSADVLVVVVDHMDMNINCMVKVDSCIGADKLTLLVMLEYEFRLVVLLHVH